MTSPGCTSQPHTWTLPPNLPHTFLPPPAQVAPVVDASSGQSRADVLGIFMSAVLLLTGLQWLSLKPREMQPVGISAEGVVVGEGGAEGGGGALRNNLPGMNDVINGSAVAVPEAQGDAAGECF